MDKYVVRPAAGPLRATIRPPGSKSITNRACVCAALADGHSRLSGALDSEDTRVMTDALGQLGLRVEHRGGEISIRGCGRPLPRQDGELFCANSGTTIRFLTALLAAAGGNYRLDGVKRMRQRPIGDLAAALEQLGAAVDTAANGCPPVDLSGAGLRGGVAQVRGDVSSQFLSGLLMAAPAAQGPVRLDVDGPLVSQPYVRMTLGVMKAFGVDVQHGEQLQWFQVAPQQYRPADYAVEPDASAASYFWAAAAVAGGEVTVQGLGFDSLQGDVQFCRCLQQMGCEVEELPGPAVRVRGGPLHGIDVDMNPISDTVQTLAAVALFADGPTTIRGVAHIRHKETDRIGDLARELEKLGAAVEELEDGLRITPPRQVRPAAVETYNDHRMAMSLALVGLRAEGVEILDPQCTGKTYPGFWQDLETTGGGPGAAADLARQPTRDRRRD